MCASFCTENEFDGIVMSISELNVELFFFHAHHMHSIIAYSYREQ